MSPPVRDGAYAAGLFLGAAAVAAGLFWLNDRLMKWRFKKRLKDRKP